MTLKTIESIKHGLGCGTDGGTRGGMNLGGRTKWWHKKRVALDGGTEGGTGQECFQAWQQYWWWWFLA